MWYKISGQEGKEEFGWTTSWGVSTRLIGGMIMTHSDDDGLVVPPKVAPVQIAILPVTPKEETRSSFRCMQELEKELKNINYSGSPIRVEIDDRDLRGGEKYWQWVKREFPLLLKSAPVTLKIKLFSWEGGIWEQKGGNFFR